MAQPFPTQPGHAIETGLKFLFFQTILHKRHGNKTRVFNALENNTAIFGHVCHFLPLSMQNIHCRRHQCGCERSPEEIRFAPDSLEMTHLAKRSKFTRDTGNPISSHAQNVAHSAAFLNCGLRGEEIEVRRSADSHTFGVANTSSRPAWKKGVLEAGTGSPYIQEVGFV